MGSLNCCNVVQSSYLRIAGCNFIHESESIIIPTLLEPHEPQECKEKWALSSSSNRECMCYSYDSAEEEGEGEWEEEQEEEEEDDVTNEFYGESESEDEIEFSDESDTSCEEKTPLYAPHVPLGCKEPTIQKCLLTLCSEESGFGENSFSESYSDGEWEEEVEGGGGHTAEERERTKISRLSESSKTWKEFEDLALCFLPSFSPRCSKDESMSAQPPICLPHSPSITEPHLSPKPNHSSRETDNQSNVNPMQLEPKTDYFCSQQQQCYQHLTPPHKCPFLNRLLVTRICPDRHTSCCITDCSRSCSSETESVNSDLPRATSRKRVSFVEGSKLVEVHLIVAWQYAYKSCRKGPWEQYARDRMHFRRKIETIASIIEPCLAKKICHISSQSTT